MLRRGGQSGDVQQQRIRGSVVRSVSARPLSRSCTPSLTRGVAWPCAPTRCATHTHTYISSIWSATDTQKIAQLQQRLELASFKTNHGWTDMSINEIETVSFRDVVPS